MNGKKKNPEKSEGSFKKATDKRLAKNQRKRRNKRQRQPATEDDQRRKIAGRLMKEAGAHGVNPIATVSHYSLPAENRLAVENQDNTIDTTSVVPLKTIANAWIGVVCDAIRHGFLSVCSVSGEVNPSYALQFGYEAIVAAFNGEIPDMETANLWFWEFAHAVSGKTVPFKTANVGYACQIGTNPSVDPIEYELGTGAGENYFAYFGTPVPLEGPNGFVLLAPPAAPYSTSAGATSFQAMLPFLPKGGKMQERVPDPGSKNTSMGGDVSAYCSSYPRLGNSYGGPGAIVTSVESEVFIKYPILATFVPYSENTSNGRGAREVHFRGGGPSYSLVKFTELRTIEQAKNKKQAMLKFMNFDEFFEVFSLIIGYARMGGIGSTIQTGLLPYPLTAQQAQIMLRQALLPYFWNQMAQDVRYSDAATSGEVQTFFPLVVASNGYPGTNTNSQVILPRFFSEAIRAIARVGVALPTKTFRKGKNIKQEAQRTKEVVDYVPVLARLTQQPIPIQYDLGTENLYKVDPLEVAIDIVDLSFNDLSIDPPVSGYVDVNGTTLTNLIAMHNEWINTYSNYLTTLAPLGRENGIQVLNPMYYTNIQGVMIILDTTTNLPISTVAGVSKGIATKSSKGILERKVSLNEKKRKPWGSIPKRTSATGPTPVAGSDYFGRTSDMQITSVAPQYESIAKYIDIMILPAFYPTAQVGQGSVVAYQTYMAEGIATARTVGNAVIDPPGGEQMPTAFARHVMMASADIKAPTAGPKEIEVELNELAKQGHGGFFTDLARGLGGMFLGPQVGNLIGGAVEGIFGDV